MNSNLISTEELYKKIQQKEDIKIIDVRTEEEYQQGHIKESINIPLDIIESEIEKQVPDKNAQIYLICRSGGRSAMAQELLFGKKYQNAKNVSGGMLEWQEKGFPVE